MAGVEDLYQRKFVGWSFESRITKKLTIAVVEQAIKRERPGEGLIFHSDRGSQYAAYACQDKVRKNGMRQSTSGKGNCYDNACMESFFSAGSTQLLEICHQWNTSAETRIKMRHSR